MKVIRDLMDLMAPRADFTATAIFYATRPTNQTTDGIAFDFSYVEPKSRAYSRIFANVVGEDENVAIRTNERLPFKSDGDNYIRLPDGVLYTITQVMTDYDKAPRQALRMFANPIGAERLLRLKVYKDGWET